MKVIAKVTEPEEMPQDLAASGEDRPGRCAVATSSRNSPGWI